MSAAPQAEQTPNVSAPDLFSVKGKHALITGGSRGIGAAMAIALVEAGASFIVLAHRDVNNTATADAIKAKGLGTKVEVVKCDLKSMEDAKSVVPRAVEIMDGKVDIVINCGGMLKRQDSMEVSEEEWDTVVDVNLKALFFICQAAGRHMVPRRAGKIVNVASLNSFIGGETVASYAASKGGVSQLTKALSNEWAKHNVQVNAIAPGSIATDINTDLRSDPEQYAGRIVRCPAGRWGTPSDFAGITLFLCSDASQFVTGSVLTVDGGWMGR